jgi:hypothetical protein
MNMASTPKLDLTMSAGVLLHYAMARAGLNEDRLKKDFRKQYQLDAITSVKTLPDRKGYVVTTENYEMQVTEYGKINTIKHTGKPRDCRVKEKQRRRDVKDHLKTAAKQTANRERVTKKYPPKPPRPRAVPSHLQERQPDSAASAIIDTIQNEAKVPRVYVKRRKDLEPH